MIAIAYVRLCAVRIEKVTELKWRKVSMSKSNKEVKDTEQSEKVVTKYDLKMQRRKEQKEKEQRDKRVSTIGGIILVVVLACVVASFPIRTWLTVNGTYIKVNGENISKVEYDYHYNMASNSYINENYYMLYYFGIDLSGDLSQQMYSDTLSWKDYFDQLAVDSIARNKSLAEEARAAGFTYDTSEEYGEFENSLKEAAEEAGISIKEYVQRMYGVYATQSRVKPFLEESLYVAAYTDEIAEGMEPAQEEIQTYYDENKSTYDSVDYYIYQVDAELPTAPTELADPVESAEPAEGDAADGNEAETYQPSEAEIAAAMELAKTAAEAAEPQIKTTGELMTNVKKSASTLNYSVGNWLFEDGRKAGDTTVIEDNTNHRYYVVGFEDRYLDQTLTADIRVVITAEGNGQEILDEWKNGAATEESFGELCEKYTDSDINGAEGGLLEGVVISQVPEALGNWISDSARVAGDTTVIAPEEGESYTFVVYYVGQNQEEWILQIRNTLLNQKLSEYLDALVENVQVEDPKGNLAYLKASSEEEQDNENSSEDGSGLEGENSSEDGSNQEGENSSEDASSPEGESSSEDGSGN